MESIQNRIYMVEFDHRKWLNYLNFLSNEMNFYKERISILLDQVQNEDKSEHLLELLHRLYVLKKKVLKLIERINTHSYDMVTLSSGNGSLIKFIDGMHESTSLAVDKLHSLYKELKTDIESAVIMN